MDKVQKIREEVERLINELIQERGKYYSSDVDDACILELQNVLTYIDSLQEEPVSEDLEDIASQIAQKYFPDEYNIWARPNIEARDCKNACIEMAKWKKKQMIAKAIDVEVKVDAGGYPYIPQMELYDYDKDVPLAKEGDKYKVVLINED